MQFWIIYVVTYGLYPFQFGIAIDLDHFLKIDMTSVDTK
jgi:hypothetical protein